MTLANVLQELIADLTSQKRVWRVVARLNLQDGNGWNIEIVDFPIKNGDFHIKHGDFPIKLYGFV